MRRCIAEELDMYEDGFIARIYGMGKKKTMLRETEVSVGRCRLTVSTPELKARLVSALGFSA